MKFRGKLLTSAMATVMVIGAMASVGAQAATVLNVYDKGEYTYIECSVGSPISIWHRSTDGKCKADWMPGYEDCQMLVRWSREQCEKR
jgi:hypothetical protein